MKFLSNLSKTLKTNLLFACISLLAINSAYAIQITLKNSSPEKVTTYVKEFKSRKLSSSDFNFDLRIEIPILITADAGQTITKNVGFECIYAPAIYVLKDVKVAQYKTADKKICDDLNLEIKKYSNNKWEIIESVDKN